MNIFPTHREMKSHDVDIGHKINGRPSMSHLLAEKGDSEGLEYFFLMVLCTRAASQIKRSIR